MLEETLLAAGEASAYEGALLRTWPHRIATTCRSSTCCGPAGARGWNR